MRGMHVIEEEVGPFSEVGLKPKGEDMGKPTNTSLYGSFSIWKLCFHIEKTFLIIEVKRSHDHL